MGNSNARAEKIWRHAASGNVEALAKTIKKSTPSDLQFVRKNVYFRANLPDVEESSDNNEFCHIPDFELSYTALGISAYGGFAEVVQILIDAGAADVNFQDSTHGYSALMWAAYKGHRETVRMLLGAKADPHAHSKNGETALMLASMCGHSSCLNLLWNAKSDVDVQNKHGWSALMCASSNGHAAVVMLLLLANANVNLQDQLGSTALMMAAAAGHVGIIQDLLKAHADATVKNQKGETAIDVAKTSQIRRILNDYLFEEMIDSFLNEISQVAKCAEVKRKRDQLQQQVDAAKRNPSSSADYDRVSRLGIALKAAAQEVHQLQLPREIYLALADRHAELVARVDARCKELLQRDNFEALEGLAKKLSALQALDVSELPQPVPNIPSAPPFSSSTTATSSPSLQGPVFTTVALKSTNDEFSDLMWSSNANRIIREGGGLTGAQSKTADVVLLPLLPGSSPAVHPAEIKLQVASLTERVDIMSLCTSASTSSASDVIIGDARVAAVKVKKYGISEALTAAEEGYMDDPVMPPADADLTLRCWK